ncbi:MAG: RNA polymerase subunit sigma-70 [Lutibacter sp.]|nr:MAG: RNA polymerase subunit sigma-70 [Lutibacter sp.]
MEQSKLIKDCINNNRQAQEELYFKYKDVLFPLCLKYCKNFTEAEDHLHDSFLLIFKKINSYKGKGSFEGWMKRIVINKAIDKFKKEKKTRTTIINDNLISMTDTIIDESKLNLSLDIILSVIQELPKQYRFVFNLYELDNHTHKEIAELLDISIGTSKSNLHRAKVILKKRIENIDTLNLHNTNSNHGS